MLAADAAVAAAVFGLEHLISYCNHTKRCFGPTSRGQGRRLCHTIDGGYELEAGSSGLYCLERAP